jgi:hypothetical protein
MTSLLEVAHAGKAVILLIHHERKSGGEHGRSIRGGSAFLANADVALLLHPVTGKPGARKLEVLGRYQQYVPDALRLEFEDGRYTFPGWEKEQTPEAMKARMLSSLSAESQELDKIADAAGIKPRKVRDLLAGLCHEGKVERAGTGVKGNPYTYRLSQQREQARGAGRGIDSGELYQNHTEAGIVEAALSMK